LNVVGLRARAVVLGSLRTWFATHGYLEVPTPVRVPSPAMEEHLFAIGADGSWLRTSPEFALKRVVSAGLPRIYEIGPCFRGRESGPWHGTEFTMLEWYRAGANTWDVMDEVESLIDYAGRALGVDPPQAWRRVSVRRLYQEVLGIDLAQAAASDLSDVDEGWDDAFFRRWVQEVEPTLSAPTMVFDWPASQAALANIRTDGEWPIADRFEVFLGGVELANAFGELVDSAEQRQRFMRANASRMADGETPHPVDDAFIDAVGRMPKTSGIAMGVDRLVAALVGAEGIDAFRV
jgi:elongation factor P--(R)-beta-lysine ligase